MKGIVVLLAYLIVGLASAQGKSHAEQMEAVAQGISHPPTVIAMLVYDNIVLQDLAGPMEVFSKARNLTRGKYQVFTVALSSGQIETENSLLKITPSYTIADMPPADYLVVPGASMPVIEEMLHNKTLRNFLINWAGKAGRKTVSVCTASYLLANAGLLDGRRATTHFFVADNFANRFPSVKLVRDIRFVRSGRLITSSGVTSGIDAALNIVGEISGEQIRGMISRALQYAYRVEEAWPVAPDGMSYKGPHVDG